MLSVEVCAGAGGQALGLERAGFKHAACIEIDNAACSTLRKNRPTWNVVETDVRAWHPTEAELGVDLLAGGVPCPPFSSAGKQLGSADERDLFPEMIRIARYISPIAVMIENVRGLMTRKFDDYRAYIVEQFEELGYEYCGWELVNAADFGVPQTRNRAVLVMMKPDFSRFFEWPEPVSVPPTVGDALKELMSVNGWRGVNEWVSGAQGVAPTLVGGSKKHGGADLGPTRAKQAWLELGVDGKGVADDAPGPEFQGFPRLTVEMAAVIQGFPQDWEFEGRKTPAYRQVGNAFPPPVAEAIGSSIASAIAHARKQAA